MHLGVNDLAYPPSGYPSAAGAALSSAHPQPAGSSPVVRYADLLVGLIKLLVHGSCDISVCGKAGAVARKSLGEIALTCAIVPHDRLRQFLNACPHTCVRTARPAGSTIISKSE